MEITSCYEVIMKNVLFSYNSFKINFNLQLNSLGSFDGLPFHCSSSESTFIDYI